MDFWEWVAKVGLDGIGGGLLGGVVAWLLLRRTINHEKTQQSQAGRDAREAEFMAGLRRLHTVVNEMEVRQQGGSLNIASKARIVRAELLFTEIAARAAEHWSMARQLNELRERLEEHERLYGSGSALGMREFRDDAEKLALSMVARILAAPGNDQPPKDQIG